MGKERKYRLVVTKHAFCGLQRSVVLASGSVGRVLAVAVTDNKSTTSPSTIIFSVLRSEREGPSVITLV